MLDDGLTSLPFKAKSQPIRNVQPPERLRRLIWPNLGLQRPNLAALLSHLQRLRANLFIFLSRGHGGVNFTSSGAPSLKPQGILLCLIGRGRSHRSSHVGGSTGHSPEGDARGLYHVFAPSPVRRATSWCPVRVACLSVRRDLVFGSMNVCDFMVCR
jgi:hypothetical protein